MSSRVAPARVRLCRGAHGTLLVLLAALLSLDAVAGKADGEAQGGVQVSDTAYDLALSHRARGGSSLGLKLLAQSDSGVGSAAIERESPPTSAVPPRASNALVIGAGIAAVGVYAATQWYEEGFGGGFKVTHEGWFGKDTKYGGMDKLGHLGFSYASTRWFASALKAIGNDDASARNIASISVLATMTAVEILDGFSRRWRFSPEDAWMNIVGVGLGWLLERYPAVDDVVDLRLRYQRSTQPDGARTSFDPFSDYEGQTYLVVAKASGVPVLRDYPWLKYLEVSAGYSARGFDPRTSHPKRYFNYGIGINVGALIEDFLLKDSGAVPKAINRWFFEYFQLPAAQTLGKASF